MSKCTVFCLHLVIFKSLKLSDKKPHAETGYSVVAIAIIFLPKKDDVVVKAGNQFQTVPIVTRPAHCALGAILGLLHNSKTSACKIMKFTPSPTFTMRKILVKNFWPLKARRAMLK